MLKMKASPVKLLLAGLVLGAMSAPEVMAAPQPAPAPVAVATSASTSIEASFASSSDCRRTRRRASYVRYRGRTYRAHYVGSRIVRRNGRLYRIRYYRRY